MLEEDFKFPGNNAGFHKTCEDYAVLFFGSDWRKTVRLISPENDQKAFVELARSYRVLRCRARGGKKANDVLECRIWSKTHNPAPNVPGLYVSGDAYTATTYYKKGNICDRENGLPSYIRISVDGTFKAMNASGENLTYEKLEFVMQKLRSQKMAGFCGGDTETVALDQRIGIL